MGLLRTQDRYGKKLGERDHILAWMPRHAANMLTRLGQYSDGRTAVQRLTGRKWGRPMLIFGEQILIKEAKAKADRNASLESRMTPGIYVGHHGRS